MSKADSVKEEIGFLKLVFAVLVALDASLVAWISQNFRTAHVVLLIGALVGVLLFTGAVVWITRLAYRRFQQLEEL